MKDYFCLNCFFVSPEICSPCLRFVSYKRKHFLILPHVYVCEEEECHHSLLRWGVVVEMMLLSACRTVSWQMISSPRLTSCCRRTRPTRATACSTPHSSPRVPSTRGTPFPPQWWCPCKRFPKERIREKSQYATCNVARRSGPGPVWPARGQKPAVKVWSSLRPTAEDRLPTDHPATQTLHSSQALPRLQ